MMCRRDSFITHRAFCDALAEENNKANEGGSIQLISSSLQCQQPILPSHQIGNVTSSSQLINRSISDDDHKHPLSSSSLPHHDLISKPFMNNNNITGGGSIFSRSLSSSPSLQLSSNSLNNIFEENGLHLSAATSPHMSATALLQKAAQMGATVSSNSTMTDHKTVANNMAAPLFGVVQQQGHGFMNHYMQSTSQQPHQYNNNSFMNGNGILSGGVGMNGVDMFNAILDQSKALSKIIEQNNQSQSNSVGVGGGGSNNNNNVINIGGSKGSGDVMTLDLLGIGGGAHSNFYGGGGAQQQQAAESAAAADEVWRNWSTKNGGFESFSATSNIN